MKTIKVIFILLFIAQLSAQDTASYFVNADAFFKDYVSNGLVDYKTIQSDPAALDALLTQAASIRVSPDDAPTYKAFWINTYNLVVIKGVISKYPVDSPLKIGGFFDKMEFDVGGFQIALNDIENNVLRAKFPQEARFHFVLVCAGMGCPPLLEEAYTPANLETQLQRQTTLVLNSPNFIIIKENKVLLSQIFEWYKDDFTQNGNVVKYINAYRKVPIPAKAKVSYYPYDWTLNENK